MGIREIRRVRGIKKIKEIGLTIKIRELVNVIEFFYWLFRM